MQVRYEDEGLARLEADARFTGGYSTAVVRGFRKVLWRIRNAHDERDLWTNATRFEKLAGRRQHEHSLRVNDQFRLVIRLEEQRGTKVVVVVAIEDYH